jgi:integrase
MAKGSIERLRTGYRAIVYAGKDPITGKKIYLKETHPTEDDAEKAKQRMLAQVEAERAPDRSATLSVLLDRWMEVADHELSTHVTNRGYIDRVLKPALGNIPLHKLQHRVDLVDRLYSHLRRCGSLCDGTRRIDHRSESEHDCTALECSPHRCKGLQPATIRRIHAILSAALNYAIGWGWMDRNPAEYAHPPKVGRRRPQTLSPEQAAQLINLAWPEDPEFGLFLWLAVTTGARRGELTALRWSDCDLQQGLLLIDENYVVRDGQRILKSTKTNDDRDMSLDALTVELLTDFHQARLAALGATGLTLADDAFVFSPDPLGLRPWHPDHFTHTYRDFADQLGIKPPLKNLRHFNATQLLASGVDLPTAAGRLGHADGGTTTLRFYAARVRPADQKAAELLAQDLHRHRQKAAAKGEEAARAVPAGFALPAVAKPLEEVLPYPVVGERGGSQYTKIAADLRTAILEGRLVAGDRMPTVDQLAAWYGVVRSTAQRAVTTLAGEGFTTKRGGRHVVQAMARASVG